MRRREAKRKQEEGQLNWLKSPINEEWQEDIRDWSQTSTPSEEKDQEINSIETKEKKNPSIYKNYIYRGKNWEYPICSAEDHCGHYHCTRCQKIHPKDRLYKMRPNQQCKCS